MNEPVSLPEPVLLPPLDWLPVDVFMPFDMVDLIDTLPGITAIWYMRVTNREMLIVEPSKDQSSPRFSVMPFRYSPTLQSGQPCEYMGSSFALAEPGIIGTAATRLLSLLSPPDTVGISESGVTNTSGLRCTG